MKTEKIKLEVTFEITYKDHKDKLDKIRTAKFFSTSWSYSDVNPKKATLIKPVVKDEFRYHPTIPIPKHKCEI